jgi:hypothetical protein
MLTPTASKAALAERAVADPMPAIHVAVGRLPSALRPIAYAIVNLDPDGRQLTQRLSYDDPRSPIRAGGLAYEELSEADRRRILRAIQPRLADDIDAAWQLLARGPYSSGSTRRPFRGPAAITLWPRWKWLNSLIATTADYDADVAWFAAHAGYLAHYSAADALGRLFAGAIDRGDDAVFDTLCATTRGDHPSGVMGRHVTRGLLVASRPDGWQAIVRLLLAAQREEGLRQVILETADEAHPDAFRLILQTILDHNLTRFSATIRAAGVWLGLPLAAGHGRELAEILRRVLVYLDDRAGREWDIARGDGRAAYLALWATAYSDVNTAGDAAIPLLGDADVERRFAAAYLLGNMQLRGASSALIPALADADPRLPAYVVAAWRQTLPRDGDGAFEALEAALPRLPKKAAPGEPLLWPGLVFPTSRAEAADLLPDLRGGRPPQRLIPHLADLTTYRRREAVKLLTTVATDPTARRALLGMLGDRDGETRDAALKALSGTTLTGDERAGVEALLGRRPGQGRRAALALLAAQPDAAALATADRLLASRSDNTRLAGLELLGLLAEAGRAADAARTRARAYRDGRPALSPAEEDRLAGLTAEAAPPPALADALGLAPVAERTPARPPRPLDARPATPAASACLESLSAFIYDHRDTPLTDDHLLGSDQWYRFCSPNHRRPLADDLPNFPLPELWASWQRERRPDTRDADGLELLRAWFDLQNSQGWQYTYTAFGLLRPARRELKYGAIIDQVLSWLIRLDPPPGGPDAALDWLEAACALAPGDVQSPQDAPAGPFAPPFDSREPYRRRLRRFVDQLRLLRAFDPTWSDAHHARFFRLQRWIDELDGDAGQARFLSRLRSLVKPDGQALRYRPELDDVLYAQRAGAATRADLFDQLLGERGTTWGYPFRDLMQTTHVRRDPRLDEFPVLAEVVDDARERILTVEVARGEMPTAATRPANALQSVYGSAWLIRILCALGPDGLRRVADWFTTGENRADALSHLLRVCLPAADDTTAGTAALLRQTGLPDRALLAAALFAPQWAAAVEAALEWPGLAEGVFWVHAHTKHARGYVSADQRTEWAAEVEQRTPLSPADLLEGAVDVAWFGRVYATLGDARWSALLAEARYAARGIGHGRAVLFAQAMLGRASRAELEQRITVKRYQDAVRALGLLPLPPGPEREAELLGRYQVIQSFLAGSKKFGAQRRESEALAARIGLDNLARTAGYPDALRLTWAMEGRETAEWLAGPRAATAGNVTVAMSFNEVGAPELHAERAGRRLKAIPPATRKEPAVAELIGRAKAIETQQKRMRAALEMAMCREEVFYAAELGRLLAHPTLAPMLAQLVWIVAGDGGGLGYPVEDGRALLAHDGRRVPLADETPLRLAHPFDLYHTGEWHLWQRDGFRAERIQPFKQLFRELYLLTAAEQADGDRSRRYAGQQVQPRQAAALLAGRGWIVRHDEGVQRTFHERGIVATVSFLGDLFTPGEVEGVTLETVSLGRPGEWWKPLPLADVPPLVFSEVMRDLDLVVSVAHSGGVDPEASASTVESRAALLRETLDLLRLGNVRLDGRHALIEGVLGSYSVHLGSSVVHRRPGGAVCIIPVHSQHRGRLFLPFADDDPKTAEVMSKVLLLARDEQIRDPSILEQLTR